MRRREFILALPLLASAKLFAQEIEKLTGVWELDISYKGSSERSKIVMMRQAGEALKVRDLETGQEYTGTVKGAGMTFPLALKGSVPEHSIQTLFAGAMKEGVLKGHTDLEGSKYQWVANRLTSVWLCSNHNPKHIAKSKEDMAKFTQEKKCEGWQRARPESLGS